MRTSSLAGAAGYDPAGLIDFLEWARRQPGDVPSFASTHPSSAERIEAIRRQIGAQAPATGRARP